MLVQGASSGLGKEIALRYAERQCPMVVSGRNEKELISLVKQCKQKFGNSSVFYKIAEAASESDAKDLVEFTLEKFGKIDILVLGAGIAAHSFFRDFEDLGAFKKLMEVNFMGYLYLCRYALDTLRKN